MSVDTYLYLDHAASSPLREEAIAAEAEFRSLPYAHANPNSLHSQGRAVSRILDQARARIASALGGGFRPQEIAFTGGGTESNNICVLGMAEGARMKDRNRNRVLISAIEHDSVLDLSRPLKERGFDVELIPVNRDCLVSVEALSDRIGEDVALVSIMAANNETGAIQPIGALSRAAHAAGALVHTDAVQAFIRIPLELDDADAVSIAGHKIGAPVGVGAIAMRSRCPFRAQTFGGGQELGRRAGTQDACSAHVFGAVCDALAPSLAERGIRVASEANSLQERLCAPGTGIHPTTSLVAGEGRLPGIVSIYAPGADSESLILRLDHAGYEVSAGSACSSGSLDPSHVLSAMGMKRDDAFCALRISFDDRTPESGLDAFAAELLRIVGAILKK
ncbi:MAG: aminotransferase class V-fold PLP-dependent enzyme [Atopobiaceae bacterium]|nr:aminotransferase class V-fold PLP-dependent enzyme [Atopobiaceae bacterium]